MAVIKAGSFVKNASTGESTQDVAHGLGVTPKALILWAVGGTSAGAFGNFAQPCIGFTDQDRSSFCLSGFALDNDAGGNGASRIGTSAIYLIAADGAVRSNALISAWDATNFTVHWQSDTAEANATIIGFLAIGGSTVQSKVVDHTLDGDTGADPIIGAGFEPDLALFLSGGNLTGALPVVNGSNNIFSLGATNGTQQWAMGTADLTTGTQPDARRSQVTNSCFLSLSTASDAYTWLASITSMDSDGCTLNVATAGTASSHLGVLFLKGVELSMGAYAKDSSGTANAVDTVNTPGMNPQGVLLASFMNVADATILDHARFTMGMSDGTNEFSGGFNEQDFDGSSSSNASNYVSTTKAIHEQNNDSQTITGLADLSLGSRRFNLTWTTNFAVATQICYIAFGDFAPGSGGGGGQGGGHGGGNGGGNGGGGNPGGGPPGQGGGKGDSRFFGTSPRKKRKFFAGF